MRGLVRSATVLVGAAVLFLAPLEALGAGQAHALRVVNNVESWGANASGQLGDGTTTDRTSPVVVSTVSSVRQVVSGDNFSLALLNDGEVWAWGDNTHGQFGDGTFTSSALPVQVTDLVQVKALAAGGQHALALLTNGQVEAWGDNSRGELGDGTTTDSAVPEIVSGVFQARQVQCGQDFSMVLVPYGTILAWGANDHGELGNASTTDSPTPVYVNGLTNKVRSISAGSDFAVALLGVRTVYAWGDGAHGQLGTGSTTDSDVPVQVLGLGGVGDLSFVRAVAAGGSHALAQLPGGAVAAWGDNANGQLGDNSTTESHVPISVPGLTHVRAIAVGTSHSLALLPRGIVAAWGANAHGQLGNGSTTDSLVPVDVPRLSHVSRISASGDFSLDTAHNRPTTLVGSSTRTVYVGQPAAVTFRAKAEPFAPTITESGTLPSGLTFADGGDGTATVSGTPAAGTAGSYPITLTATGLIGAPVVRTYTLVVKIP